MTRPTELEDVRELVDKELDSSLPSADAEPRILHDAIRYSVFAGGKRLRPALVILASRACGGQDNDAMPAACAVECIHTYSLIHDDLPAMDNDDLRRGRPTSHKRFGEAVAILAGDALLTFAFELVSDTPSIVRELAFASGTAGMIAGQVADMEAEGLSRSLPPAELQNRVEYIHRHKTAALIRASLRMGALSAGASDDRLSALTGYGEYLGLAFQIIDDILDVTGTEEDMGKAVGKDIQRGKLIHPAAFGLKVSRERASNLIRNATASLEEFGEKAGPLRSLAAFVGNRSS
jgi:geranylgeranyl diphosphate synthase type II